MCSKLTNHIKNRHKTEDSVKEILKMDRKNRNKGFMKLKRLGTKEHNKIEALKENPEYQGERKTKGNIVQCSVCTAFLSRRFFSRHRRKCSETFDTLAVPLPMVDNKFAKSLNVTEDFSSKVLEKIRHDEIGKLVRSEEMIIFLGLKQYNENKHKKSKIDAVRKSARGEMRLLGQIYHVATSLDGFAKINENLTDLFSRENFFNLVEALEQLTERENGRMKAGTRHKAYYLLVKSCKRLRDRFFIEKKEALSQEIESFLKAMKSSEELFLGSAENDLELQRLQKPCQLPLESDI